MAAGHNAGWNLGMAAIVRIFSLLCEQRGGTEA